MLTRTLNLGEGLVNGQKCVVLEVSPNSRVIQIQLLSSLRSMVLVLRVNFHAQVGRQGIKFSRVQFPLLLAYSLTIHKSQGQALSRVGLDLRHDIFAHGRLYVALSRIKNSHSIMCLLPPSHIANSVPHAPAVVYPPFIKAAVGTFVAPHPPFIAPQGTVPPPYSSRPPPSPPPPPGNPWTIVSELGDGACRLGCISRKVVGNLEQHATIRANIVQYIQDHLHDTLPNAELSFHNAISFGIGIEPVQYITSTNNAACKDEY